VTNRIERCVRALWEVKYDTLVTLILGIDIDLIVGGHDKDETRYSTLSGVPLTRAMIISEGEYSLSTSNTVFGNTCIIRSSQAATIYSIQDKSMTSRIPYVPWTYPIFMFNDKESFRHICIYYSEYKSTN
jgi:hypothetical protein